MKGISIKQKREMVATMLMQGERGAARLGLNAAYAFKKAPMRVARDMRALIPQKYYPLVLSTMVLNTQKDVGIETYFRVFPEHHELLRGIALCMGLSTERTKTD